MADKVLLSIKDRFIKSIVLKNLFERDLEIIEALDEVDLFLKLDIFKESILFYIIEIDVNSYEEQYYQIKKIKSQEYFSNLPIMAVIPDGSKKFVRGAKEVGIDDVFLQPLKRELVKAYFIERLSSFIKKVPEKENNEINKLRKNILSNISSNNYLKRELKRADRGKYSVSFVMGRISGIHIGMVQEFYDKLILDMRDTDRIINHDYRTFILVCPFTEKQYLVQIEKKLRTTFENMFGGNAGFRKLYMYSVTYRNDGDSLEELVQIMEKGVHDSIIVSGIRQPLNTLSKEKLEEYRNMLRLYK